MKELLIANTSAKKNTQNALDQSSYILFEDHF